MFIIMRKNSRQRGVSLIEVLISLLVIAVGVLGLAKMQALALSNSQVSGTRGLIALQASSLASLMHSNKGYWQVKQNVQPPCFSPSCTVTGTSTSVFGSVPSSCLNTNQCTPAAMAAWDMSNWMTQANTNVPGYTATINCSGASGANIPVTCSIEFTWLEKQTGAGTATASIAAATPSVTQSYYLYVQP